jgi:hypothetical protein
MIAANFFRNASEYSSLAARVDLARTGHCRTTAIRRMAGCRLSTAERCGADQ